MTKIMRGQTLSFGATHLDVRHHEKGAVAIGDDGTILWSGPITLLPQIFLQAPVEDYRQLLVMPGFIDAHIHFPQYRMLAAPGADLLDWLNRFTFPEEARYADEDLCRGRNAEIFLDRLFRQRHDDGARLLLGAQAVRRMRCSPPRKARKWR